MFVTDQGETCLAGIYLIFFYRHHAATLSTDTNVPVSWCIIKKTKNCASKSPSELKFYLFSPSEIAPEAHIALTQRRACS